MEFHIESAGEGPAVLFIHAGVADSRMWADQLREFSSTHQAIAFDKRGFGKTAWRPGPFSDTEDSVAVLDRVGVDSATIVGCSMGAATALNLVIEYPDRVDGLVLVGGFPSGWIPEGGFDEVPLEEEAATAHKEGNFARVVEIDLQMWLVGYGRSEDDIDPDLKELFRDMDRIPVPTEAERNEHQTGFEMKLNDHLDVIDAPTLVIVGAHDETVLGKAADYLADRLSDRPAVTIEDAAHLPSLEQPKAFNAVLREFLSST
ncbi:MAG: alpha/beta fold hydrolase [Acidimicrobiia bacterium]